MKERASGGGEEETPDVPGAAVLQELEKGAVLAVDGKNGSPEPPGSAEEKLASHYQGFLVRQGKLLAGFERGQGGFEPGRPGYCQHHGFNDGILNNGIQPFFSGENPGSELAALEVRSEFRGLRFIPDRYPLGTEFLDLLPEGGGVSPRGQPDDLQVSGKSRNHI